MAIDLTNCDKEPIHISGRIQPFGFLLVIEAESLVVEQASENVADYLGLDVAEIVENSLPALLPEEHSALAELIAERGAKGPRLIQLKGRRFFCFIHESSTKIILECEPFTPQMVNEAIEASTLLSNIQEQINQVFTLEEISAKIADAVQSVLDFDRVLIFRFDPDWNAEVVAEKAKAGIHSFEGHHFPASDIPAPARELLRIKHIRHIPDVRALPVAIMPYLNPSTNTPTDILNSELRYPSEIHLEYLENMGVASSLSFSVIVKGELWGLISCTNEQAEYINFWKRQQGEQLARAYANMLVSSQEKRDFREFKRYKKQEEKLLEQMMNSRNAIMEGLLKKEVNLLSISKASGVAVAIDKRIECLGACPEKKDIKEMVDWLRKSNADPVFYTRHLSAAMKGASDYREEASGLLALEISRFNNEYLLFFKPEIKEKRIWAGNPEKPVAGKDLRIHPRKSFEKWEEAIKGKSHPWSVNEVEIALILLKDVTAVRLKKQARRLEALKEEYQLTAEGLEIKNKQLEDFARIITHNLRSPLANVQALYAIYKAEPQIYDPSLFLDKIKEAIDKMLGTLDDLNLILRRRVGEQWQQEKVNIRKIVEDELHNLEATILEKKAAVDVDVDVAVSEVEINKIYIESIVQNLLSNALKYSSPERAPRVTIKCWREGKAFYFRVSDNGQGIDLEQFGEKLFGIYKTFHKHPDARGVGLYLTKMQVEAMGGTIEVQSQPGKGAIFTVKLIYPLSFRL